MTDIATSRSPTEGSDSTATTVKDEARRVGQTAADAGGGVVETTKEQAAEVMAETRRQARDLYGEARRELRDQAGTQQQRAAGGLRSLSGEIRSMAAHGGQTGPATELAHRASEAVDRAAGWLESREPGMLVDDLRRYARQHPGAFLAGAAALGVLAGRLTRGLAAGTDDGPGQQPVTRPMPDPLYDDGGTTYRSQAYGSTGTYGGTTTTPAPMPEPMAPPAAPIQPGYGGQPPAGNGPSRGYTDGSGI